MCVQSLGQEDPQEKEMATCSSIIACKIPWTEEPLGLQSMGSQRGRHNLVTEQQQKQPLKLFRNVCLNVHYCFDFFFCFFFFYFFIFLIFFLNFKIFNSYMRSQT